MRTAFHKTILLLLVSLAPGFAQVSRQDTLIVHPGDEQIALRHGYVIPESVEIDFHRDDHFSTDSLQVNSLDGKLSGFTVPDRDVTIVVRYRCLDLNLPRYSILNPPPRLYLSDSGSPEKPQLTLSPARSQSNLTSDFLKSGTLYRGFSLGSQSGFALKSGLNLELEGKVSEDIAIVGSLTDQNIPIQPEGNTQTLDEIDKVFIRVDMPHEKITFGDYELSIGGGELGRYQRKLQGIYIESERDYGKTAVGGAVSKGQYHSNFFMGEEGKQGPYQLYGKEGETAIIVLAGTEKVWVDGRSQVRGENADYVIDYSSGEITFTPNRLITSDSRLTVDFQYSNLIYSKNIWLASSSTSLWNEKLKFSVGVMNESDDRENPIELTLSQSDKERLRVIGDDAARSFITTITADSGGAYILTDSILVFAGSGGGTHSATFYNVGKQGQYKKVYDGINTYFQWIDRDDPTLSELEKDEIEYLPVRPLKLPCRHRQYNFAGAWAPSENVTIQSEFAASDLDKNTFSPANDGNNLGTAMNLTTQLRLPLENAGEFLLSGKLRNASERFAPIDRNQIVEYARQWDLPSDSTQGEQLYEAGLGYRYKEIFSSRVEGGRFSRGELEAGRYRFNTQLHYKWLENTELNIEQTRRPVDAEHTRLWTRRKAFSQLNLWGVKPFAGWEFEQRDGDPLESTNFQFLEQRYGFESKLLKKLLWRLETRFRRDEIVDQGQWRTNALAQNLLLSGQLQNWHNFSSQWNYTFRRKQYKFQSETPDVQFQLLYLTLAHNPKKLPVRWETNMKVEEEQTVKKEYRYFYVGKGEGAFIYDSTYADYVPDVQGDYVLRILPSNIKEPVTSIQNGFRLQFQGSSLKNTNVKWIRQLSTLTDIRLQQQIRRRGGSVLKWRFSPARIDGDWSLFQRIIQQDIQYRLRRSNGYLKLRYLDSDQNSALDVRGADRSQSKQYTLLYKGNFLAGLRLDSELNTKTFQRQSDYNSLRNRDLNTLSWQNQFSYLLGRKHLLEYILILNHDEEQRYNPTKAFLVSSRTSYERKIAGKGRWKCFVEIDNVKVTPRGNPIPWEMSKGKKEGGTFGWGALAEYRIGSNLSVRMNYEGWNEPHRPVYHMGGGEIRALF